MRNPLSKRFKRDLKDDFGKYAVIFLLMTLTIGYVSGFLVAGKSMIASYNDSFVKYNIEDGHINFDKKLNKAQVSDIEQLDIKLYENFYLTGTVKESSLRIFANREQVDKVDLLSGELPLDNQVALDRLYARNNDISVGDRITYLNQQLTVSGFVALSDYSALFDNNNEMMFDSIKFGVGIVSINTFNQLSHDTIIYQYAYKWNNKVSDENQLREDSEQLAKDINSIVTIDSFLAEYDNQAIHFTGDDMGSDTAMVVVLLYIVIIIMAFVFTIITNNTIQKEANVIGTLRASGYTRNELVRHYMAMPILVTIISAIIGNILGYTVFKNLNAELYYNSYSLPTFVTLFNSDAFIQTTIYPIILIVIVNYVLLRRSLSLTPLQFIRRDLRRHKNKNAIYLNKHLPFLSRFRIRIILQNLSNYIVLFIGIIFCNLLLYFGLMLPAALDGYQEKIADNMIANYQTMLAIPSDALYNDSQLEAGIKLINFASEVETENNTAEKFSAYTVKYTLGQSKEEITLYGISENSKYVDIDHNKVYISHAFADKYSINIGDTVLLKEAYKDEYYQFVVDDIYDYDGALALFMDINTLNKAVGYDNDFFVGYFSDTPIDDIDEKYIGSIVDFDALTKISRQLDVSMGSAMYLVDIFSLVIFVVVIYLLSKTIIEKNAQSISMIKILGFNSLEVSKLYVIATSIMVVLFILVSVPIEDYLVKEIWNYYLLSEFSGYFALSVDYTPFIKMIIYGIVTYALMAWLQYRRIKKVNLAEALKNVE